MNKNKLLAILAMVFTAMIWGITFEMVQNALNTAPPLIFATLRFGIGFVLGILYLGCQKSICITREEFNGGIICGIVLYSGYAFQNFGLWEESTFYIASSSSNSAFITSMSVILVPVFIYIFNLETINNKIWGVVGVAIIGLSILLDPFQGNVVGGDVVTFGCAISFAVHIILQDIYLRKKVNFIRFFIIQVFVVSLFSFIASLVFEGQSVLTSDIFTQEVVYALFITGVLATFIGFILMLWAQKILSPTQTGILLSLEPLFAALYVYSELTLNSYIGGFIIIMAVMSSSLIPPSSKNN